MCNVLGKGDRGASSKKNAVTWMINRIKENKPINLYDGGEVYRDFLHVNDVCKAIKLICEKGNKNEIYNVSSGKPTKIKYLIELSKKITHSSSIINYVDQTKFHSKVQNKDFWMENNKIKELGFNQTISLEKIVEELQDAGPSWSGRYSNSWEIEANGNEAEIVALIKEILFMSI